MSPISAKSVRKILSDTCPLRKTITDSIKDIVLAYKPDCVSKLSLYCNSFSAIGVIYSYDIYT